MLSPAIRKGKIIDSWFKAAGLQAQEIVRYPGPTNRCSGAAAPAAAAAAIETRRFNWKPGRLANDVR
jgi:hypothetical protein